MEHAIKCAPGGCLTARSQIFQLIISQKDRKAFPFTSGLQSQQIEFWASERASSPTQNWFFIILSIIIFLTQQIIKKQSHLNTNPSSVYYFGCQWSWLNSEGVFLPRSPIYMVWFRCSLDGRRRLCTTCICQLAASRFTWPSYDKFKREKEGDTSLLDVPPHMAPAPHPTIPNKFLFASQIEGVGKQVRERQRIVHILVHQKCLQI